MRSTPDDLQKRYAAHSKANEHYERWRDNARSMQEAGEIEGAREARRKARFWRKRMKKIEGG